MAEFNDGGDNSHNNHVSSNREELEHSLHVADISINILRDRINSGEINPDQQDRNGMTPLMVAARDGLKNCVEYLVPLSKLHVCSSNGQTALMWAAANGKTQCLELLINPEIDPNSLINFERQNPHACLTYCRLLHQDACSCNLDKSNKDGNSALMLATIGNHSECVQRLLSTRRVNVNRRNKHHKTALMLASEYGLYCCFDPLLNSTEVDVNLQDDSGNTALIIAVERNHFDCVRRLIHHNAVALDKKNCALNTAFMRAAAQGHIKCLEIFIDSKKLRSADINEQDKFGKTSLMLAAWNGHTECVSLLLNMGGIDISRKDQDKNTALMLASLRGNVNCVELLANSYRVQVNEKDKNGKTALMLAAMNSSTGSACIQYLIGINGININSQDDQGNTALMVACMEGNVEFVRSLIGNREIDLNKYNIDGNTALMLATMKDHPECVECLLNTRQVYVNSQNNETNTALMIAAKNNCHECLRYLINVEGIEINCENSESYTSLMLAAKNGNENCVEALLSKTETNVLKTDRHGRTAFLLAAMNGNIRCLRHYLDITAVGESEQDNLNLDRGEIPEVNRRLIFRTISAGYFFQYTSDIIWRRPLIYGNGQRGSSVLNMTTRSAFASCLSCFLLGKLDDHQNGVLFCNMLGSECDNDGNTAILLASSGGHFDCLEYLLQVERIRFHALVLLIRQELINTESISLVLDKKLCSLIQDVNQVAGFYRLVCNGHSIGQCVDFLLSAFLCRTNEKDKSKIAFSYAISERKRDCFTLLAEFLAKQIPCNQIVFNLMEMNFRMEAEKVAFLRNESDTDKNFLFLFLKCDIFHWLWYPLCPHKKQRFLARELVLIDRAPNTFPYKNKLSSPLQHAFMINDFRLVQYLLANLYLTQYDLQNFQKNKALRNHVQCHGSMEIKQLHWQLYTTPWRLETLCLLNLRRDENFEINSLLLPESVLRQWYIIRGLCIRQWNKIADNFLLSGMAAKIIKTNDDSIERGICCNGACLRVSK